MDKSIAKIVLYTVIGFFTSAMLLGALWLGHTNYDRVVKGVTYMNRDISGLSQNEVLNFFKKEGKDRTEEMTIILQYGGMSWSINKDDIGLTANAEEAATIAYSIGRNLGFVQNFSKQLQLLSKKVPVSLNAKFDENRLREKLLQIKSAIDTEPVNATVTLHSNGMITKTDGVVGKKLDVEKIIEDLKPKLIALEKPEILILAPAETQPYIKTSDVASIDSVLASYSTRFYSGDRGDNIVLASSKLNDILVRKDEIFSFNTSVGARTKEAGYKNAPVIIEGKVLEDVGGGVCQVSSTLYNAVLLAGLTPTIRAPHFYPSDYCPPGLDATVADGVIDFQFRNPLSHPVYLVSSAYGNELTIYILGTKSDLNGNSITLESSGTRLEPTIHRVYAQNGVVTYREFMHTDYYDKK